MAALVFTGGVGPPLRLDTDGVDRQGAERLQNADERERDQSDNHGFNVLPLPDPSSDRARDRVGLTTPRARVTCLP